MKRLIYLTAAVLTASLSFAAVIHVPADQPTIQAAIDAAAAGDTVTIAPGTYTGTGNRDLDFNGKNLVVKSDDGPSTVTLDCEGSASEPHRAFVLHSGEDSSSVIDGLTIRGAYWSWASWQNLGGAINCNNASPIIQNCIISDNQSNGIVLSSATRTRVSRCEVSRNRGTGIWVYYGWCDFFNSVVSHNDSAGIWVYGNRPATVDSCVVAENNGDGVTLIIAFDPAYVYRSTIVGNRTGLTFDSNPPKGARDGARYPDTAIISNNVIAFNYIGISEGWYGMRHRISCTDSYGNQAGDWVRTPYYAGDAEHNMSLDPQFCDRASGNYTLRENSPLLPAYSGCPELIGRLDVGCPCCSGSTGNADGDGDDLTDISDMSAMVDYLFMGGTVSTCFDESDVDKSGSIDISDLQALVDFLFFGATLPPCP